MSVEVGIPGRYYSMGEVVRETGVPAATLRAWERRYGVPRPQRSSGRQRLYSAEEVALLKWLIARQREGMSISRAISAWSQRRAPEISPQGFPRPADAGQSLESLRALWIDACLRYDQRAAQSVLNQAFALYPWEEVCGELLLRGLSEMGDGWSEGRASVQQEHFASVQAAHQIERLIAATPSPWRRERILLACPPDELHSLSLLFLSFLLRQRGWDTVLLGANVPSEQLEATIAGANPDLVILAAQRLPTAGTLIEIARTVDALGVLVGYGGLVFNREPDLQPRVPGHFLGETLFGAPSAVEKLLAASR